MTQKDKPENSPAKDSLLPSEPSRKDVFQYSILALPLAFAGLPLYIHAPDFYTRDLGMSIGVIGFILLAVRLFDAVQDPVLGYLCDRYTKLRLPIVTAGMLILTLGMGMIFLGPPAFINIALWFALSMIFATTGFSIVAINLNMIGGFWHDDKAQRTRISAWREGFMLAGLLIASVLPSALQEFYGAEQAFEYVFIAFAVTAALCFFLFSRLMRKIAAGHKMNSGASQKGFYFLKIITGPDKGFFATCFLTHIAAAFPGVLVLFFIRDYLQAGNLAGLFLLIYFVAGALLITLWVRLADRLGKEQAWLISMAVAVATFSWAYFLQPGDIWAFGVICALSGMALGADLALPPSILADRVTAQKTESEATQYFALLAFIPKISIALTSGVTFVILDFLGFVPGEKNDPLALQALITVYALVPCVIKIAAMLSLWYVGKKEGVFYENSFKKILSGNGNSSA